MSLLIQYIHERIRENKNVLLLVTGETGGGKSYIAIRLGEILNPHRFNINRVVFTPEDFMALINSGRLEKGDVIVFDEAGVGIPSKEWYEISNRLMMYVLQTFRIKNLIVIFTTPSISFIDNDSRKLLHGVIEPYPGGIDFQTNTNKAKFLKIQHNSRYNKNYYKRLIVDGVRVNPIYFSIPSENIRIPYEAKKEIYINKLNQKAEDLILQKAKTKRIKSVNISRMVKDIIQEIGYFGKKLKNGKTRVDYNLIMGKKDVGLITAKQVKALVEKEVNYGV